jgi:hypothetical protein
MRPRRGAGLLALLLACLAAPVAAQAQTRTGPRTAYHLGGHLKLQPSYRCFRRGDLQAADGETLADLSVDARLNLRAERGRWDVVAQVQALGVAGDSVRLAQDPRLGPLVASSLSVPARDLRREWLDLDHAFVDDGSRRLVGRLDRLSVGYTGDHLVVRLGRQALSWGNGLVFSVLDLFDPFEPNAADTEYKPGTDMLWGQWLADSGDDVQALVVPRRDPVDGALRSEESSLAVKWHHVAPTELQVLAAVHFDDRVLGLGASHDLAGGVARADVTYTRLAGGGGVVSALANLDHSWVWAGHNVYGFVELYHNGFGERDLERGLAVLDPALLARLDRGEVFVAGRDEAAVGARVDLTPLTSLEPTLLVNAEDGSGLALLRLRRDLGQDLRLDVGLQLPWGGRGSEYGGLLAARTATGDRLYTSPGNWLYVRLSRYF